MRHSISSAWRSPGIPAAAPQIDRFARNAAKRDAQKKPLRDRIVELVHLDQVEAPRSQETRDRRGSAMRLGQLALTHTVDQSQTSRTRSSLMSE